ncbi:hypothetical protein BCR34DRAFT_663680 [Clohesyomyces aquaticus]|uniref:Uncharacterized protein n=1 Tax=Clohesyomyces aquaticus TaxID=1231657 RepID=A0A1Y1ZSJ4_9PLEO|nr:hypothetical protein BCR34DRAFT_663680 [Clohesyomyces aquaticus]
MEPLSVAAGLIDLAKMSEGIVDCLSAVHTVSPNDNSRLTTYLTTSQIYSHALAEHAESLPSRSRSLPRSIELSLQACRERLLQAHFVVSSHARHLLKHNTSGKLDQAKLLLQTYYKSSDIERLEGFLHGFNDQAQSLLQLLHHSRVGDMSHDLGEMSRILERLMVRVDHLHHHTEGHSAKSFERLEAMHWDLRKLWEDMTVPDLPNDTGSEPGSGSLPPHQLKWQEKLELTLQRIQAERERVEPDEPTSDDTPYTFNAKLISETPSHTTIRGILDTGSRENWISKEAMQRASLASSMEVISESQVYAGFGGELFQPCGTVEVTWYTINAAMSRRTTFLVNETGGFDMVLGASFIKAENILMFNEPVLALRHANLSQAELREMERAASEEGKAELETVLKARNMQAREQKRQKKQASRMSTPWTQQSRRTSFLYSPHSVSRSGTSNFTRGLHTPSVQGSSNAELHTGGVSGKQGADVEENGTEEDRSVREEGSVTSGQIIGVSLGPAGSS